MRLDHLLSREQANRKRGSLTPGRYRQAQASLLGARTGAQKTKSSREAKVPVNGTKRMTVIFLNLYRFQGSQSEGKRKRTEAVKPECTLKTAQPDGKHLVKKPVAKLWKQSMRAEMRTILQLVSGERNYQRLRKRSFDSYSDSDDQVTKGAGWMPWHWTPKKDVVSCEKPRGAASRL